jgi:cold shock CspA family protein
MDTQIQYGVLKYWNQDRAFGIIRAANALKVWTEYFVHVSAISSGDPVVGCSAEFIVGGKTRGALLPALRVKLSPKPEITPSLIATLAVRQ